MKVNMELDGEPISIEQSSPSDNTTGLNVREDFPYFNDSFNNADGMINHADAEGRIKMIAAVAGQNTPNYFDQDNFYPADGLKSIGQNIKGFFSDDEAAKRREGREGRKNTRTGARADERKSRADLNREIGKDKQSDIELAKALKGDEKPGMSTTTKVLIGVGVAAVLGAVVYFTVIKKK